MRLERVVGQDLVSGCCFDGSGEGSVGVSSGGIGVAVGCDGSCGGSPRKGRT